MGTVTITSAGFAALPGTAPAKWPGSSLVWPAGGSINGSKAYTISDADAQQLLSWIATQYNTALTGNNPQPVPVSAIAIVLAWLNGFMNSTTQSTQSQQTTVTVPPPISIA